MGVLADWQIRERVKIEPFADGNTGPASSPAGLTSYGYDLRLGRHFKVFTNALLRHRRSEGVRPEIVRRYRRPTRA